MCHAMCNQRELLLKKSVSQASSICLIYLEKCHTEENVQSFLKLEVICC